MGVTLRPVLHTDIPMLEVWDSDSDVMAAIAADVRRDWHAELERDKRFTELLIGEIDGHPFAFVELCDAANEESHYWGDDVEQGAWALDIWIGQPQFRNRGLGTTLMQVALARCFDRHDAKVVFIDPLVSNVAAHRFYERLGFQAVGVRWFDDDECLVYRLPRPN